jgi:DNA-binding transcriptional LysR family regulator
MDLQSLALFVDVAKTGGFAPVARARGVDPSSISRSIAALEAQLRMRLFQRTTRSLALTDAGEILFAGAPDLINASARLLDEASVSVEEPVGTVRLTASVAFGETCLVPLLNRFTQMFPRLTLDLVLTDTNVDMVADRIDLAIRLGNGHRADYQGRCLFETRYHVVASPTYVARSGQPLNPQALSEHYCLLFALPEFRSRWKFRLAGVTEEVPVEPRHIISNALALRQAARDGCGPALLSDWLIDADIASGVLVDLFPDHEVAATSFATSAWLLWPGRDYMPRRTREVMHFLIANLRRTVAIN